MDSNFSRDILIVDEDPVSYQILQNCFFSKQVVVHWAKSKAQALDLSFDMGIILCSTPFQQEDAYELMAELGHRHPKAVMFMLPENYEAYDAFQARNSGALGAFFKPLSFSSLESRLEEFLGLSSTGTLEHVSIPSRSEQVAKLISYQTASPEIEDIESIVREVLPVVVEQVLRIQLQNNSILRDMVNKVVQDVVELELSTTIQQLLHDEMKKKSE